MKYLLADIGSTFTKLCLADVEQRTVLGTTIAPTTVKTDVNQGVEAARQKLGKKAEDVEATLACSSAAGGLRMVAVGLIPNLTAEAARLAALGAGGKVVETFSFLLTEADLGRIRALRPDILLLSGGTDGGDVKHILHNARQIQNHLPDVPLIVAGNRSAHDEIRRILDGRREVWFVENVMPDFKQLRLEPAREAIRRVFLERIVEAKGLTRLCDRARILMPTPEAVFKAAVLLSKGIPNSEKGMGELLIVDIGGATTDVYSCAEGAPALATVRQRGLREPCEKRTVEADIGMRHTASHLLEEPALKEIIRENGAEWEEMQTWTQTLTGNPGRLPQSEKEQAMDTALASAACEVAVGRHCGRWEEAFCPDGRFYFQDGKDLSNVRRVIGSGGPIVNSKTPRAILAGAKKKDGEPALKPRDPNYYLDTQYLLWAMGLLAEVDRAAALEIMKKNILPLTK
ncbi:MAG: methylaspartate mutase accessory protein GlmL [Verrucomicrobiae bacterium]|nr:methylaspartate mutase accessory protein GlmL [Verrucomicrobiae bacterium]